MTVLPSWVPDAAPEASPAVRGWRALPAPLVLAMCLSLVSAVASGLQRDYRSASFAMSPALNWGLVIATRLLEGYGLVVLARRQPRTARIGLYAVIGAMVAALVLSLGWQMLGPAGLQSLELVELLELGWGATAVVGAIGFGLAMWPTRRAAAIAVLVAALVVDLVPTLFMGSVAAILPFDPFRMMMVMNATSALLHLAVMAWVFVRIAGEAPAPAPAQISRGLGNAGLALRALVVVLLATLILGVGPVDSSAGRAFVRFLSIGDLWLGALCLGWVGISLAQAGVVPGGEPGAYLIGIAGALVLVCGGCMLYSALEQSAAWLRDAESWGQVLSSGQALLLAPLAGTVLAAAIARLAGRAGIDGLRRRATMIAIGFGALFAPVFLMSDRLMVDTSPPVMFVTAGLVVAAGLLLAALCKAASQALAHTDGAIPVARVV